MKRLWLCAAATLATLAMLSCIPVDDFGTYWDKGVVDPALEGTWKHIGPAGDPPADRVSPEELRFTRTGSSYSVYMINPIDRTMDAAGIEQRKADNARAIGTRTLRVGNRRLLMQRSGEAGAGRDGILTSYEIHGRTLSEYWIRNGAAVGFLRTRHPGAKNIHKNDDEGEFVVIGTFDDEVFGILSEIADVPTYWGLMGRYQKTSN